MKLQPWLYLTILEDLITPTQSSEVCRIVITDKFYILCSPAPLLWSSICVFCTIPSIINFWKRDPENHLLLDKEIGNKFLLLITHLCCSNQSEVALSLIFWLPPHGRIQNHIETSMLVVSRLAYFQN